MSNGFGPNKTNLIKKLFYYFFLFLNKWWILFKEWVHLTNLPPRLKWEGDALPYSSSFYSWSSLLQVKSLSAYMNHSRQYEFFQVKITLCIMHLVQWYRTSMCFDLKWNIGFLPRWIALWQWQYHTDFSCSTPNSLRNFFIHKVLYPFKLLQYTHPW